MDGKSKAVVTREIKRKINTKTFYNIFANVLFYTQLRPKSLSNCQWLIRQQRQSIHVALYFAITNTTLDTGEDDGIDTEKNRLLHLSFYRY